MGLPRPRVSGTATIPSATGGNKVELLGDSDETLIEGWQVVGLLIVWHSSLSGQIFLVCV